MTFLKLAFRSLCFQWGINATIFLIVVIISTILTGALFIGDSMRKSLRETALKRLGCVDSLILSDHWLSEQSFEFFSQEFSAIYPEIMIKGSIRSNNSQESFNVVIYGVSDSFWQLSIANESGVPSKWEPNEIVVNESLAKKMGISELSNAQATIYLNDANIYPMESLFASSDDLTYRYKASIRKILNDQDWPSNFSLFLDQRPPFNLFIPLSRLQRLLHLDNKVNIGFCVKNESPSTKIDKSFCNEKQGNSGSFSFDDLNLYSDVFSTSENQFVQIKNRHFLFSEEQAQFLISLLQKTVSDQRKQIGSNDWETQTKPLVQGMLTHLVNSIQCEKLDSSSKAQETNGEPNQSSPQNAVLISSSLETPYSLITGLNVSNQIVLLKTIEDQPVQTIEDDEIYLNSWTADDLNAKPGDIIVLRYYLPENSYNQPKEQMIRLRLAGILKMEEFASNAQIVSEIEHLTDAQNLADWNPPFPFDAKKIRPKDEEYWSSYRTTPKGFVSLQTSQKLFGSRFGKSTALFMALPLASQAADFIPKQLKTTAFDIQDASLFGISLIRVRENCLNASNGSTPFDVLFLCFSFFIVISVLILLVLFIRLSVDCQSKQIGILKTFGFSSQQITKVILLEYIPLTLFGAFFGIFSAMLFTKIMIYALNHYWISAIGIPFLKSSGSICSALIGFGITNLTVFLTIFGTIKSYRNLSQNDLLKQRQSGTMIQGTVCPKMLRSFLLLGGLLALTCLFFGISFACQDQQIRMASFFGTACLTLVLLILTLFLALRLYQRRQKNLMKLSRLFLSYLAEHAFQTSLSIGLLASSLFIIIAVGNFKLKAPSILSFPESAQNDVLSKRNDGGFALITETSLPFFINMNEFESEDQSFFSKKDSNEIKQYQPLFFQLRATSGENVGCSNLYQGTNPRILGVPSALRNRDSFLWADFDKKNLSKRKLANPFELLTNNAKLENKDQTFDNSENQAQKEQNEFSDPDEVPIILDQNTALYSLHLYGGIGDVFPIKLPSGKTLNGKVVALLSNSIFQGEILMSEENLLHYFPQVEGYQILLTEIGNWDDDLLNSSDQIEHRNRILKTISNQISRGFLENGSTTETTIDRLSRFNSVQNTYIAIFQALGGLGVLLGTFGLAVVRLRSFLERKYEFCLLRMLGFSRWKILGLVSLEAAFIIFISLYIALSTALIALLPELTMIFDAINQFNNDLTSSRIVEGEFQQIIQLILGFFEQFKNFHIIFYGILLIGFIADWVSMFFVLRLNILQTMKNQ